MRETSRNNKGVWMQYNYFPGRLRFRDPVLRDGDIRKAALDAVSILCPQAEISY